MTSTPPRLHQSDKLITTAGLKSLFRKTIALGIVSALSYPLLAGISWVTHLIVSGGKSTSWVSDTFTDIGMSTIVGGLTITAALAIIYVGLRDWANPDIRSTARARRTALTGIIAVPFIFALLAITITVINAMLHAGP